MEEIQQLLSNKYNISKRKTTLFSHKNGIGLFFVDHYISDEMVEDISRELDNKYQLNRINRKTLHIIFK